MPRCSSLCVSHWQLGMSTRGADTHGVLGNKIATTRMRQPFAGKHAEQGVVHHDPTHCIAEASALTAKRQHLFVCELWDLFDPPLCWLVRLKILKEISEDNIVPWVALFRGSLCCLPLLVPLLCVRLARQACRGTHDDEGPGCGANLVVRRTKPCACDERGIVLIDVPTRGLVVGRHIVASNLLLVGASEDSGGDQHRLGSTMLQQRVCECCNNNRNTKLRRCYRYVNFR